MKTVKQIALISFIGFLLTVVLVGFQYFRQNNSSRVDTNLPKNTPSPSSIVASPSPTSKLDNLTGHCLVQISGNTYDVTALKSTHSGGDIFQCSTDMTSIYFSQHTQSHLNNQMARYKIN